MSGLTEDLDAERRASLGIQVTMRWFLLGVALFMTLYRAGTGPVAFTGIVILIVGVTAVNGMIAWRLKGPRRITRGLALGASLFDAVSITAAVGLADGFNNDSYLFYYPALLAFGVVFGARLSIAYVSLVIPAYTVVSTFTHDSFDYGDAFDQKRLVIRLATMGVTVLMANLIVRIERHRRERAVVAEAERGRRVLELEREASEERHRLAQEIHDGISQRVYMLTLGLETAKALAARVTDEPALTEPLDALVHLCI